MPAAGHASEYPRAEEVRGKAGSEATRIYGAASGEDPEFDACSRTLEACKEAMNPSSMLILTTDSDYRHLEKSAPAGADGRPGRR